MPRLVKFSGNLTATNGQPLTGVIGVTFALYEEEQGGAPLWMETQNVAADAAGHYTAMLGATRNEGVPAEVFASGQGRWLGVQPQGEPERPRVLMTSVPYALKAVDAETLGGLPASAFALSGTPGAPAGRSVSATTQLTERQGSKATTDLTGTGTADHIAYWTNSTTIGSSALYQTTAKKIGLGTTTPTAELEVQNASATAILGIVTATSGNLNGVNGQTASTSGYGVSGVATATSGSASGVYAQTSSPNGNALFATNSATSGYAFGIQGFSASPNGVGVQGNVTAPSGSAVTGINSGANGGTGVSGVSNATSGFGVGVSGSTTIPGGTGVFGVNNATSGGNGVQGQTVATNANGVFGINTATSGFAVGVNGQTNSPGGTGVNGLNLATTGGNGVQGQSNATNGGNGVFGMTASTNGNGVIGINTAASTFAVGVNGQTSSPAGTGVNGLNLATTGGNGVQGQSNATSGFANGVSGQSSRTSGNGVYGSNNATSGFAVGVNGQTTSPAGVGTQGLNLATTGGTGVQGQSNATSGYASGVYGQSASTSGVGVSGNATATSGFAIGVQGQTTSSGGAGVFGVNNTSGGFGLDGQAGANGTALFAVTQTCNSSGCTLVNGTGGEFVTGSGGTLLLGYGGSYSNEVFSVDASGNGFFKGNLNVTGKVTKGSGSFKIDHPLDPEHKYLSHSFVESPDMMDIYNGNVTTNERGVATVVLPDYFEALNGDFRYQLTVIGQFAQAIVAKEISHGRFTIKTNRPKVRVSWQVTGIRHDAYANANRIPVTEEKAAAEQGTYLHPDVFGKSENADLGAGSH
ncbi:MAG TPA: hypothetical protein VMR62_19200 [Bryobacteraceae bacterium]|nr:hypothetical protein [Bryobacteraceae bacterium]